MFRYMLCVLLGEGRGGGDRHGCKESKTDLKLNGILHPLKSLTLIAVMSVVTGQLIELDCHVLKFQVKFLY